MANIFGFGGGFGNGVAIGSADGIPADLAAVLEQVLGGSGVGGALVTRDPAELKAALKADLQRVEDLAKRIKKDAAGQLERRAKAAIEALLILNGMADHFYAIKVFGVDSFELVLDPEFDITLGELAAIGRAFETSAISMDIEYRSAEEPEWEAEREFCPSCNDYHEVAPAFDPDFRHWEGERIVIAVRGVGIDLQNPPV